MEFIKGFAKTWLGRVVVLFVLGGAATVATSLGYVDVANFLQSGVEVAATVSPTVVVE